MGTSSHMLTANLWPQEGRGLETEFYKKSWTKGFRALPGWCSVEVQCLSLSPTQRWPCPPARKTSSQPSLCRFSLHLAQSWETQRRKGPAGPDPHSECYSKFLISVPKVLPAFCSPQVAAFWAEAVLSTAMSFSGAGTGVSTDGNAEEASQVRLF